jgi:tripartite-type tricarboxylate transporter receptor subunit TctC
LIFNPYRLPSRTFSFLLLLLAFTQASALFADPGLPGCSPLEGSIMRWVVPNKPGGGYDTYSRLIQPFLENRLGVQVRIENRPEAGGLVGALMIRDAVPDGKTLGLINAAGLLASRAIENGLEPDVTTDFTILAQVVSNQVVLFTGADSGFRDIDELISASLTRPIVFGVRDAGSTSFFSVPVTAELLGMEYALVSGYVGSAARTLALMRGEVDVVVGNFDSLSGQVKAGELIPLLQLTASTEIESDIPQLGGPAGVASRRAAATGRTHQQAEQAADDLALIAGAGRLVAAPAGLPANLSDCLETALGEILQSPELLQAASRARLSIEYQNSATAYQGLQAGDRGLHQFRDLINTAIRQVRE